MYMQKPLIRVRYMYVTYQEASNDQENHLTVSYRCSYILNG